MLTNVEHVAVTNQLPRTLHSSTQIPTDIFPLPKIFPIQRLKINKKGKKEGKEVEKNNSTYREIIETTSKLKVLILPNTARFPKTTIPIYSRVRKLFDL